MGKIFFFIFVFLLITNESHSQNNRWKLFSENEEGEYYYDTKFLINENGIITIWEKYILFPESHVTRFGTDKEYVFELSLIKFDCPKIKYILSSMNYRYNDGTEEYFHLSDLPPIYSITPESRY